MTTEINAAVQHLIASNKLIHDMFVALPEDKKEEFFDRSNATMIEAGSVGARLSAALRPDWNSIEYPNNISA